LIRLTTWHVIINETPPTHERLLLLQFIKYDRDVTSCQVLCEPKTNFNCFLIFQFCGLPGVRRVKGSFEYFNFRGCQAVCEPKTNLYRFV